MSQFGSFVQLSQNKRGVWSFIVQALLGIGLYGAYKKGHHGLGSYSRREPSFTSSILHPPTKNLKKE